MRRTQTNLCLSILSHPSRVRGLKFQYLAEQGRVGVKSHPSRVRGLKSVDVADSNDFVLQVAPFTGAWIEILARK